MIIQFAVLENAILCFSEAFFVSAKAGLEAELLITQDSTRAIIGTWSDSVAGLESDISKEDTEFDRVLLQQENCSLHFSTKNN